MQDRNINTSVTVRGQTYPDLDGRGVSIRDGEIIFLQRATVRTSPEILITGGNVQAEINGHKYNGRQIEIKDLKVKVDDTERGEYPGGHIQVDGEIERLESGSTAIYSHARPNFVNTGSGRVTACSLGIVGNVQTKSGHVLASKIFGKLTTRSGNIKVPETDMPLSAPPRPKAGLKFDPKGGGAGGSDGASGVSVNVKNTGGSVFAPVLSNLNITGDITFS